jgi:hypothetical protein
MLLALSSSLSQVWFPWYLQPYFTVLDLRLPFSSPPTTPRVTVKVFDTTSTQVCLAWFDCQSQNQSHIVTDGQSVSQSVSKSWLRASYGADDQIFITVWQLWSCFVERPLWRENESVFCICCWSLPAQSFSDPSPLGLATIFYCLRFEISLFVASYDSQGHGGGIGPRLHTSMSAGST